VSDRLRVGVVGAGFMGGVHLAAWAAESNPTVVFSLDPTQAATLAARHGAALARSLDELLGWVDVVDVCTETDRHAEVAIAAARAGRHVICEKPLARTLADAEAIVDACAEARVRLFVAHVVRFFPEYALAREQVVAGEVGLPAVLRLRRASFRPTHPPDHWFFDHARSGGMIVDLMIHDFPVLVDQTQRGRLGGERRAADRDVALPRAFRTQASVAAEDLRRSVGVLPS